MLQVFAIGWLASVLAQTNDGVLAGVPPWLIVLIVLLVVVFAVVWTLHEEEEKRSEVVPVSEPETRMMPVPETAVTPPDPAPIQPDDLTKIEGIGPKISSLLRAKGIATFAQLAAAEVDALRDILLEAKLRVANPETWPEQAALAAAGNWEALTVLQGSLKGGRRQKN